MQKREWTKDENQKLEELIHERTAKIVERLLVSKEINPKEFKLLQREFSSTLHDLAKEFSIESGRTKNAVLFKTTLIIRKSDKKESILLKQLL